MNAEIKARIGGDRNAFQVRGPQHEGPRPVREAARPGAQPARRRRARARLEQPRVGAIRGAPGTSSSARAFLQTGNLPERCAQSAPNQVGRTGGGQRQSALRCEPQSQAVETELQDSIVKDLVDRSILVYSFKQLVSLVVMGTGLGRRRSRGVLRVPQRARYARGKPKRGSQ